MLSIDDVAKALPPSLKSQVTPELVMRINSVGSDTEEAGQFRDNFVSYSTVLTEGKFKIDDYINAVKYVSHKIMGRSNREAYELTFPHRAEKLAREGKDNSPYVNAYNNNILVNKIIEQSIIPTWIVNRDVHQKAINTLSSLMATANSEKVRCDAANAILTHLSKPKEAVNAKLKVSIEDNSGMSELKNALAELAQRQLKLMESGVTAREIASEDFGRIIDVE